MPEKERNRILNHLQEAGSLLQSFMSSEAALEKIEQAGRLMVDALNAGNKIISCGNGGSMCDAMHFAEELSGRFRNDRKPFAAMAISDPSHMSCVGNDYGFHHVFSRFIEAMGRKGDVLLVISTSGNSENIVKAVELAHKMDMSVVGLTGKDGGFIAPLCDVEIRAPHSQYADRAQEIHIKVIHCLIDYIEQAIPA